MIKLLPEEHKPLAEYIYSICAVALDRSKAYLIEGRLGRLAEEAGCRSLSELAQRAKSEASRALERRIIDAITTNETLFFRDTAPFELLRHKIVPGTDRSPSAYRRGADPNLERRVLDRPGDLQYRHSAEGTARRSRPVWCPAGGHRYLRRCRRAGKPRPLQRHRNRSRFERTPPRTSILSLRGTAGRFAT